MKKSFLVTSVLTRVDLPAARVEQEINRLNGPAGSETRFADIPLAGFENISWHFANVFVKGEVEIGYKNRWSSKSGSVHIPTAAGFFATCIQTNNGNNKLAFGTSLS